MKILRLMCLALLLLLTSCSLLTQTPPDQAVKLAITQQLIRAQKSISQNLGITDQQASGNTIKPNFKIDGVTIQSRNRVVDFSQLNYPDLDQIVDEVYKVNGKFDATLTSENANRQQKDSRFEVLLGRKTTQGNQEANPIETWYFVE